MKNDCQTFQGGARPPWPPRPPPKSAPATCKKKEFPTIESVYYLGGEH